MKAITIALLMVACTAGLYLLVARSCSISVQTYPQFSSSLASEGGHEERVTIELSPARPADPPRLLAGLSPGTGRFSNEVISFSKMMWLAASLNRTLVPPTTFYGGVSVTSLFDPSAITAYFAKHGGGFATVAEVGCHSVTHVFVQRMNNNLRFSTRFKGPVRCSGNSPFAGARAVRMFDHPRFAVDYRKAADELAAVPMLATTGTAAFYMSVPVEEFPVIRFHPAVLAQARRVLADLPVIVLPKNESESERESETKEESEGIGGGEVTMCIHVRREDMKSKQPSLEEVVADTLATAAAYRVTKLFVAHNANAQEVAWMRQRLPAGTQFGCDPKRWSTCKGSAHQIAVEQAVCSLVHYFLGSPESTFTAHIAAQREVVLGKEQTTMRLLNHPPNDQKTFLTRPRYHYLEFL